MKAAVLVLIAIFLVSELYALLGMNGDDDDE